MRFKIRVIEKSESIVEINARTVTEALAKAEKLYYEESFETGDPIGVEFIAELDKNKTVKL